MKDHGYSKILRLRNNKDVDELRDKAADRTELQCLVEKWAIGCYSTYQTPGP